MTFKKLWCVVGISWIPLQGATTPPHVDQAKVVTDRAKPYDEHNYSFMAVRLSFRLGQALLETIIYMFLLEVKEGNRLPAVRGYLYVVSLILFGMIAYVFNIFLSFLSCQTWAIAEGKSPLPKKLPGHWPRHVLDAIFAAIVAGIYTLLLCFSLPVYHPDSEVADSIVHLRLLINEGSYLQWRGWWIKAQQPPAPPGYEEPKGAGPGREGKKKNAQYPSLYSPGPISYPWSENKQ